MLIGVNGRSRVFVLGIVVTYPYKTISLCLDIARIPLLRPNLWAAETTAAPCDPSMYSADSHPTHVSMESTGSTSETEIICTAFADN